MSRVISWLKRHWLASSLLVLILTWQVFWWHFNTPIRNPWPQDTYIVKGRFPFHKGYDLVFMQSVYGGATWHQRVCGMLSLRDWATCGGGNVFFKPRRVDGEHYEVTLYRDYYFAGLPGWKLDATNEWPLAFKAGINFDYEKAMITSLTPTPVAVCDDSPQSIEELTGKLFCMPQYDGPARERGHWRFKHLLLPASNQAQSNAQILDFWMYSELDAVLLEQERRQRR
jgi:hypothetical protein